MHELTLSTNKTVRTSIALKALWTAEDIPDQTGRVAIVTGANSGIGFETARALAAKNASVILACRSEEKGIRAADKISKQYPQAEVEWLPLDLSSLQSVAAFAEIFLNKHTRLDLLINNAGVMIPPYTRTIDGFELQFGTNHLGHFALTGRLWGRLEETSSSRVVNVSSLAHRKGKIDFTDLHWQKRRYKPWQAYGDSKIANLFFTFELQRRCAERGTQVRINAAHPGWTATELQRNSGLARFLNPVFAQQPCSGAWPTLLAATDDTASGGEFYGPGGWLEIKGHPRRVKSVRSALDRDTAARLWVESETMTGIRFWS